MNKRQLIDDIRRHNSGVRPEFLAQFDEQALQQYLDRLDAVHRKHLQITEWVRGSRWPVAQAS